MNNPSDCLKLQASAALISRFKKERFLRSFSEDEFRDQVVRPLYFRLGLTDGRDLCGPDEEGKDALFLSDDPLGGYDIVVVQTKKGNLNLTGKARDNLNNAVAQLRVAAETTIVLPKTKEKRIPSKVILCASGKINAAARKHIADELTNPHLRFADADELIPQIDQLYPELWLDIDADVLPYMRALRKRIEEGSDNVAIAELVAGAGAAATDAMFVDLYLWRTVPKLEKRDKKLERVPKLIEIPVTAIPKKPERLVLVLGEAGAGKSTALRRIAYVLAKRAMSEDTKPLVPVLLRAFSLAQSDDALLEALVAETNSISQSAKPVVSNDDLREGRVVALVDALDEVSQDHGRKSVLGKIEAFHASYPRCLVVLASREYAFLKNLNELGEFAKYRVQQISLRQAQRLVEKLERKGGLPVASSKELIRRLEEIHGMDLNPLLITVFAATTEYARQDIPANITELFKKFTEMMLGRWDAQKGFAHQFHAPLKDFLLMRVAYEMHIAKTTTLDVADFKKAITDELESRGYAADVGQLFDEIVNRSGLLRVVDNKIEFRHLLLQEFFAGRGIPSEDLLDNFVFDDWWRRAVVFYFGDRPGSATALSRIRNVVASRGPVERFTAASTLGLALQASYLVPLAEKLEGIFEVITHLAELKEEIVHQMLGAGKFPLTGFLTYYILGRDAVAFTMLESSAAVFAERWQASATTRGEREAREFWLIVGLMEAGKISQAEGLIRKYRPADPRFLLALHLGAFIIEHLRVSTAEQKKSASRISERLVPVIRGLREQVFDEFKTHLLEMRDGRLTAIPESSEK